MSHQPAGFLLDLSLDLLHLVGGEIRQAAIFEIGPDLLDGIELGSIRREPFRVPVGGGLQIVLHAAMAVRATEIPQEDTGPSVMAGEVAEKAEDVGAADIFLGTERQVEGDPVAARGDHEGAEPGDFFMRSGAERKRRGESAKAPGPANDWGHQEAGLIEADQPGAEAREFF